MSEKLGSILLVDDSPEDIRMLLEVLKEDYKITAATTPNEAFKSIESQEPDLIILDVNMPEKNGYEVCEDLKNNGKTKDIDVLFLSANDSTDEIIKGFDVGALDYIIKPYLPEVLKSKINKAMISHRERKSLSNAADSAVKVAMTAMSDSGDLGLIVKFMRSSFAAKTPELLAENVIHCLKDFQLEGVVLLKRPGIEAIRSTNGEPCMLEIELLSRLHGHEKPLIEKGRRLFVCHQNTVILIKSMPEDKEKCGRYRDYFLMLAEGANARLDNIAEAMKAGVKREVSLKNLIEDAEVSLREIQEMQLAHKKTSVQILDDMVHEVEKSFFPMGLTDEQEHLLLELLHHGVEKALRHFEHGIQIDDKVKQIIQSLSSIRNSFHDM